MLRRTLALVATNVAFGAALVMGASPASAAPVASAPVVTLTYDDSRAAEFKDAVAEAAAIWSASAPNVKVVKAVPGQRVNIRVIADDDWPRATLGPVRSTGSATIWMGRRAVNEGFDVTRIAAHEMGHSLGLPDNRTGLCSDLMSGSSAPTSCTNAQPNATEAGRVQNNYSSPYSTKDAPREPVILVDAA